MSRVGTYLLFTEQESEAGKSSPDFGIRGTPFAPLHFLWVANCAPLGKLLSFL